MRVDNIPWDCGENLVSQKVPGKQAGNESAFPVLLLHVVFYHTHITMVSWRCRRPLSLHILPMTPRGCVKPVIVHMLCFFLCRQSYDKVYKLGTVRD
jgi:hypothetical protein